eukprot:2303636-Amphidinium_carterae.2
MRSFQETATCDFTDLCRLCPPQRAASRCQRYMMAWMEPMHQYLKSQDQRRHTIHCLSELCSHLPQYCKHNEGKGTLSNRQCRLVKLPCTCLVIIVTRGWELTSIALWAYASSSTSIPPLRLTAIAAEY